MFTFTLICCVFSVWTPTCMIICTWLRLNNSHSFRRWPAMRVTAFNLSPYPSLYNIPPLHSPLTILCVHVLVVFNPSVHMLWHIACCVCQLVNARCTAADKDQKDITNNRLLTGERDTQVPLRKSPLYSTIPSPAVCPTTLMSVTPQQGTCTAFTQIIVLNWMLSLQKTHRAIRLSECVTQTQISKTTLSWTLFQVA